MDSVLENNTSCQKVTIVKQQKTNITTISDNDEAFVLCPNPAKDILYIRSLHKQGDVHVVIRDLSGRILLEQKTQESVNNPAGVPVSLRQLPPGIYHVSMIRSDVVLTKKMIKI